MGEFGRTNNRPWYNLCKKFCFLWPLKAWKHNGLILDAANVKSANLPLHQTAKFASLIEIYQMRLLCLYMSTIFFFAQYIKECLHLFTMIQLFHINQLTLVFSWFLKLIRILDRYFEVNSFMFFLWWLNQHKSQFQQILRKLSKKSKSNFEKV